MRSGFSREVRLEDVRRVYAKQCPQCHSPNGPTAVVCAECQASLKGIPLTHGAAAQPQPRVGRRWDLVIFILLGGGLLSIAATMLGGMVERPVLGIGLGTITAAATALLALLAAWPLRPLDEDRQWGTSALYVLLFIMAIAIVMSPLICVGALFSWFF